MEKAATLREMKDGTYTINDVLDALDVLDAYREAEAEANKPDK